MSTKAMNPLFMALLTIGALKSKPSVTQRKFKCEVLRYLRNEKIPFSNDDYGILKIKGINVDYRDELEVCYMYFRLPHRVVGVCVPYVSPADLVKRLQKYSVKFDLSITKLSNASYDIATCKERSPYETLLQLKAKAS